MDVVFGSPFSNSTFGFFERATGQGHAESALPYYLELYEPITADSLGLTTALFLLFDHVEVVPWDFPIPGTAIRGADGVEYRIPELDMSMRHSTLVRTRQTHQDVLSESRYQVGFSEVLGMPTLRGTSITAANMAAEIVTSSEKSIPLICGAEWQHAYLKLSEMLFPTGTPDVIRLRELLSAGGALREGVGAYSRVCGLTIESAELEVVAELRAEDSIRRYAGQFVAHLQEAGSPDRMFDAMREARDSSRVASEMTRSFAAGSRTLSVASLVPGVGSVIGAAGLGLDLAAARSNERAMKHNWFAFGPEVKRFESDIRLRRFLDGEEETS